MRPCCAALPPVGDVQAFLCLRYEQPHFPHIICNSCSPCMLSPIVFCKLSAGSTVLEKTAAHLQRADLDVPPGWAALLLAGSLL